MPLLEFSEWLPDQAPMTPGQMPEARNVLPQARGYGPFPSPVAQPAMAYPGTRPHGKIWNFTASQGETFSFVGSKTALYQLTSSGWSDVTRLAGPYNTDDRDQWSLVQWGDFIYAVNGTDSMQRWDLRGSTNWTDVDIGVAGLTFRQIFVVRDFLVGIGVKVSGVRYSFRVHWSALGAPESFPPDAATQAGFQDIPDLGAIQGGIGGEQGLLAMERGAIRMTYIGSPLLFDFDAVERSPGCVEPNSVFSTRESLGYLSESGFVLFNGTEAQFIGVEKIDRWFTSNLDWANRNRMITYTPEQRSRVFIVFPGPGNSEGQPNTVLVYDTVLRRWSYAQQDLDSVGLVAAAGQLADDIADFCDDPPYADVLCDSPVFTGGDPFDAIIDQGITYGMVGPPLVATLDTAEIVQKGELLITEAEPIVTGAPVTITARVGTRKQANQSGPFFGPVRHQERNGMLGCRDRGRFPRVQLVLSGEWLEAVGVRVDPVAVSES